MKSLSENTILTLSPHARFYHSEEQFCLSTIKTEYKMTEKSAEVFDRVKFLLDGSKTIGEIAKIADVTPKYLVALLEIISADDAAVRDVTGFLKSRSADEFLEHYYELCDFWAKDIFIYPFWEKMLSGEASDNLVFGWGIEFYHRVVGADEHNSLSVNFCGDDLLRRWLTDHFAEEADHGYIFLDGLEASGFRRAEVAARAPLPSTCAVINFLNVLAVTDIVAYLGCYGVMHSPRVGQTRENIDRQFDNLKSAYPAAEPLLNKIHEHAALDIDLGHDGIVFEKLIRHLETVDGEIPVKCLGAIKGIVTAFNSFFSGIYNYYGNESGKNLTRNDC